MKKKKITYQIKWIGLILASIVFIISTLFFIKEMSYEKTLDKEVIAYQHTTIPRISYDVQLKPNMLYNQVHPKQGLSHIAEFIEDIKVTLGYTLTGSKKVQIDGEYEIIAQARGYNRQNEDKQIIWTKDYTVLPVKAIHYLGDRLIISEDISIDFNRHNEFVRELITTTRVNMPAEFVVTMKGRLEIQIGDKIVTEEINQSILIPLAQSYFNIAEQGTDEKTYIQNEIVSELVPIQYGMIIGLGIVSSIAFIVICCIALMTEGVPKPQDQKKTVKRILSNYNEYMVAVESLDEKTFISQYKVCTIEDLIKVADELEKPIMYLYSRKLESINKFYVVGEAVLYMHEVVQTREPDSKSNMIINKTTQYIEE